MLKQLPARLKKQQQGLSLIEIMVAIAVAVLSITALVVVSNTAVRGVDTARGRTTADQYVREGVEQLRAYRDKHGWGDLTDELSLNTPKYFSLDSDGQPHLHASHAVVANNPCSVATSPSLSSTYQVPNHGTYYRIAELNLDTASELRVTMTVCFNLRNGTWQSASAETLLTNWR